MTEYRVIEIAELNHFHTNPRIGDIPKIKGSLKEFGQFRDAVVNVGTQTGRPNEVLIGNQMMKAAAELGWDSLECRVIDVDDVTAAKIVAIDNKSHDDGDYDKRLLAELLDGLPDLMNTGYNAKEMDLLMRETAAGAEAAVASFSDGLNRSLEQPQGGQQAPGAAPPASFSDDDEAEVPVSTRQDDSQEQSYVAPAQDETPYFTVSYTVTGEERETIQKALRKVMAEDDSLKSPQAMVRVCAAYLS